MKLSAKLILILGSICSTYTFAGPLWNIDLYNFTSDFAKVKFISSKCWYAGSLSQILTIGMHEYGKIDTEEDNSGNCFFLNEKELLFTVNNHLVKLYSKYTNISLSITQGSTTQQIFVDNVKIFEQKDISSHTRSGGQTGIGLLYDGRDNTIKTW